MDDVHFILRHAMTGAVFVIFTAAGVWLFGAGDALLAYIHVIRPEAAVALAILGFPIIGITIQGGHYFASVVFSGHPWLKHRRWPKDHRWFEDPARKLVRGAVVKAIAACRPKSQIPEEYWKFISDAPADAFFVWLYHGRATPHMIEWARRRRSYSYLGWNWFLAAFGGMVAAALIFATRGNDEVRRPLLFLLGLLWSLAALWAGARMRRDADTMEAIWAASQIDPAFRECVYRMLPKETVESPEGMTLPG